MHCVQSIRQNENLGKVKGISPFSKGSVLEIGVFSSTGKKMPLIQFLCILVRKVFFSNLQKMYFFLLDSLEDINNVLYFFTMQCIVCCVRLFLYCVVLSIHGEFCYLHKLCCTLLGLGKLDRLSI